MYADIAEYCTLLTLQKLDIIIILCFKCHGFPKNKAFKLHAFEYLFQ